MTFHVLTLLAVASAMGIATITTQADKPKQAIPKHDCCHNGKCCGTSGCCDDKGCNSKDCPAIKKTD